MNVIETPLDGVLIIEPDRFDDERGWFTELWNDERYRAAGLHGCFGQNNVSYSRRGVLRGMHFQSPLEQGKLVTVLSGSVFDVAVDMRRESRSLGSWYGCELSTVNRRQLWIPPGFAHGFLVTSDEALVHYGCTTVYSPAAEHTLAWDDPDVAIKWPAAPGLISAKDSAGTSLQELIRSGRLSQPSSHGMSA